MHIKIFISVLAFIVTGLCQFSLEVIGQKAGFPVRFMFYNVENLFDIYDDPLIEDDDFLPAGLMRWNSARYYDKINSIYKTITAAGEWDPPAIVAFCEVENRKVLEDLIRKTSLSGYDYDIIHEDSPDERGIDVCLIYRKNLVSVSGYRYLVPGGVEDFSSRSVLYSRLVILSDTIHLFVNHWPSRRGGVLAGENLRHEISEMVANASDSVNCESRGLSKIIILGDFNCLPDDGAVESVLRVRYHDGNNHCEGGLINLSRKAYHKGEGTYRYRGIWEMLDQVIVSRRLIRCDEGLYTDENSLRIFRPDFLLKPDPSYPGMTTFSTYRGYRYQGGFSDHLPVLVDLHHH